MRTRGCAKGPQGGGQAGAQVAALHGEALHGCQGVLQLADERAHVRGAAPVRHQRHLRKGLQALQQLAAVLLARNVLACIPVQA